MTRVPRVGPSFFRRVTRLALVATCGFVPTVLVAGSGLPESPQDRPPLTADASVDDRDWSDDVPAHLAVVEGRATIERDGRVEDAEENIPLLAGDRLRTERGRVEVLYGDGSSLDIDEYSSVDLLDDSLIRLAGGRIRLAIVRTNGTLSYRVDAAGATTWIRSPGEYRVAITDPRPQYPEVTLAVFRGSAELATPLGRTLVRAGMAAATTSRTEPSLPFSVNVASGDVFDRWADEQHNARLGYESARYLPTEIQYYSGYFDRQGSWEYQQDYGYVWYPTVAVGWRPYYDGRWSVSGSFGWFWVGGGARWAYPTHHYGRWGSHGNRWYWIPDRRWSPAWVSWAYAPGYVSWCPLGYNGRPVYGFGYGGYRDHWRGWSVAPSHAFSSRAVVRSTFVSGDRIDVQTSSQFVERRGAPARPGSMRADVGPIRSPGASTRGGVVARSGRDLAAPLRPSVSSSLADRAVSPVTSSPSPVGSGGVRSRAPLTERGPVNEQRTVNEPREDRAPASRVPASRAPLNRQQDADVYRDLGSTPSAPSGVERRGLSPTPLPSFSRPDSSTAPQRDDRAISPSRRVAPVGRTAPPVYSSPEPDVRSRSIAPRTYSSAPLDQQEPDRAAPSRVQRPSAAPRDQPQTTRPAAPERRGGVESRSRSSAPTASAPSSRSSGGESRPSSSGGNGGSRAPSRVSPRGGGR